MYTSSQQEGSEDSCGTPDFLKKGKRKRPAGKVAPSVLHSTPCSTSTSSSGCSSKDSAPSSHDVCIYICYSHKYIIVLLILTHMHTDILHQTLFEVRSSNEAIKEVSQLEKTVAELQSTPSIGKRVKLAPSREERVSTLYFYKLWATYTSCL